MSIFLIFKIIGGIILVLLSLVIILAALLLFAPFRYKLDGCFLDEKPEGAASATWLLSAVRLTAEYHKNERPKACIRLFGIKIYDILGDDAIKDKKKTRPTEKQGISEQGIKTGINVKAESETEADTDIETESSLDHNAVSRSESCISEKKKQSADIEKNITADIRKNKKSLPGRITAELKKLCSTVYNKMKHIANSLLRMIKAVYASVKDKTDRLKQLYELYHDEKYEEDLKLLKSCIKKLIKELRPTGGHGYLIYGGGDPYSTGRVMEIAAMLHPVYCSFLKIKPDFNDSRLETTLNIRGRIRLFFICVPVFRIYFNKNLRAMYSEARKILKTDVN